jgi:hypothetical protein
MERTGLEGASSRGRGVVEGSFEGHRCISERWKRSPKLIYAILYHFDQVFSHGSQMTLN